MNNKYQTIKPLFDEYDIASNEASECLANAIVARNSGKKAIANYLEKTMYPKLAKKSYELFCEFSKAVDKL